MKCATHAEASCQQEFSACCCSMNCAVCDASTECFFDQQCFFLLFQGRYVLWFVYSVSFSGVTATSPTSTNVCWGMRVSMSNVWKQGAACLLSALRSRYHIQQTTNARMISTRKGNDARSSKQS